MPRVNVRVSEEQYESMMHELDELLEEWIVNNAREFYYLGVVTRGLTPRMHVNFSQEIYTIIQNIIGADHPKIINNITHNILLVLESSIESLFSIRDKSTFTAVDIKTYLYNQLKSLLNYNHNSLIDGYITILSTTAPRETT
jgi:hypothetical protein